MARPTLKRTFGFAAIGSSLLLAGLLSACGDDEPDAEAMVIQPSSYSTIVSTTSAAAAAPSGSTPAGGTVAGTQVYIVQSGDFLSGIADDYGIPPESIAAFNDWDDGIEHAIHPDQTINIPPGAQVPDPDDEDDDETPTPTRTPRRRIPPTPRQSRRRSTQTTHHDAPTERGKAPTRSKRATSRPTWRRVSTSPSTSSTRPTPTHRVTAPSSSAPTSSCRAAMRTSDRLISRGRASVASACCASRRCPAGVDRRGPTAAATPSTPGQ